jgi:hypothetical protein
VKVILNSDVLYHSGTVVRDLRRGLCELFSACRDRGHEVVIPLTARLEFDRHQRQQVEAEQRRLAEAYELLERYGVDHGADDPGAVVTEPDLIGLIRATGVTVEEAEPTSEDLWEAHRRAALHESPHPPDSKSDEMRDLVIWLQALRLASAEDEGALLVSRDVVHIHARGDEEAGASKLIRVSSVEEGLEFFEVRTPAGRIIEELVGRSWEALRAVQVDLPDALVVKSVADASFVQGETGVASASASIKADSAAGAVEAQVRFSVEAGRIASAELNDLKVAGNERPMVVAQPDIDSGLPVESPLEDLAALREVVGE